MATLRWKGGAAPVSQVTAYVFGGTWETSDIVTCTIGSKTFSVVGNSTTISTVVDAVVTAWNALSSTNYPEFAEITASRSSNSLVLTADTAGVPFTCTVATTETGGGAADAQTIDSVTSSTGTDSTACQGPNFWSVAANWDGGTVPVNSDTVYIENSDVDIKYGLAQSAVTLTALHVLASYTGSIGLPERNTSGTANYAEYRSTYLAISATTVNIGDGDGQGSGRIKLNVGTAQCTLNVRNTSQGAESNLEALLWKGTHASNEVNITKGSVGIAVYGGETATVSTLRVGYRDSQSSDSKVRCGSGVTHTTLSMSGGEVILGAGLTTITKTAGDLTVKSGNVTTWTDDGGDSAYLGTGTVTTLNLSNAKMDFGQDMRTRTVTNCNLYQGAEVHDPFGTVTFTNPFRVVRASLEDVKVNVGMNRTYAISS